MQTDSNQFLSRLIQWAPYFIGPVIGWFLAEWFIMPPIYRRWPNLKPKPYKPLVFERPKDWARIYAKMDQKRKVKCD